MNDTSSSIISIVKASPSAMSQIKAYFAEKQPNGNKSKKKKRGGEEEIEDACVIGAHDSKTGPGLVTPEGALLRQCCCGLRNFVSILANTCFLS